MLVTLARMNTPVCAEPSPSVLDPVRLPKKWPHTVSEGDSTVKIYREAPPATVRPHGVIIPRARAPHHLSPATLRPPKPFSFLSRNGVCWPGWTVCTTPLNRWLTPPLSPHAARATRDCWRACSRRMPWSVRLDKTTRLPRLKRKLWRGRPVVRPQLQPAWPPPHTDHNAHRRNPQ